MTFRLINPAFKTVAQQKAEQHAPAVLAWLQANAGNHFVTLAELRAGLPAIAADLTRPVVNEICRINGIEIDDPADTAA